MTVTPSARKLLDDLEQALALARRKRRVGLVEHQDARLLADGAGDLDQLHFGDGEPRDLRVRIERRPCRGAASAARASTPHLRARHKRQRPTWPAIVRHHDVFGDAERRAERQLLIDDDDAGGPAVERRAEPDGLPSIRGSRPRSAAGRRPGCSSASTCRRRSRRPRHGLRPAGSRARRLSSASTPGNRLVTPAISTMWLVRCWSCGIAAAAAGAPAGRAVAGELTSWRPRRCSPWCRRRRRCRGCRSACPSGT